MKNFSSLKTSSMILKGLLGAAFTPIEKDDGEEARLEEWSQIIFKALTKPGALDVNPCPKCQFVTSLWTALKAEAEDDDSPAVKKCVSKKIPIIARHHPEMENAQVVAIAFSMCRKDTKAYEKGLRKDGPGGTSTFDEVRERGRQVLLERDWAEELHPRGEAGKFAPKGEVGAGGISARVEGLTARNEKISADAFRIVNTGPGWKSRVKPEDVKPAAGEARKLLSEARDLENTAVKSGAKMSSPPDVRQANYDDLGKKIDRAEKLSAAGKHGDALDYLIGVSGQLGVALVGVKHAAGQAEKPKAAPAKSAPADPSGPSLRGKDAEGLVIVADHVASEGHGLAEDLHSKSMQMEGAVSRKVDLEISRKKKDAKLLPEAQAASEAASAQYSAAAARAKEFQKKHGLSVIDAWEATRQQGWPHYRVAGSYSSPKYVTESKAAK